MRWSHAVTRPTQVVECVPARPQPHLGTWWLKGGLRGELVENRSDHMILTVGLFDGIGALRVALDALGAQVIGHVSVEKEDFARRGCGSTLPRGHCPGES